MHHAVERARQLVNIDDTLIVVTADHSHALSLIGYPYRNESITGKFYRYEQDNETAGAVLDGPATLLVYANGPSSALLVSNGVNNVRQDLNNVDTEDIEFMPPAFMPSKDETHGGEDVAVYAIGPYSHLFTGTIDNTFIAYGMAWAACITDDNGACNETVAAPSSLPVQQLHSILLYVLIALCLTVLLLLIAIIIILYKTSKSPTMSSESS